MKLSTLFSRRKDGGIQAWVIEVVGNEFRTKSWVYPDGKVNESEWTQCRAKRGTSSGEQASKEAQALWQKRVDLGDNPDIDAIDTKKYFEPMLAYNYKDYQHLVRAAFENDEQVHVQPKLDGMRCIATAAGMFTRNGKPIVSAPHVLAALQKTPGLPVDWMFDGELYADKFKDDFNKIISLAKKTKPTTDNLAESAKHLQYHIYDMPSNRLIFSGRSSWLNRLCPNDTCIQLVQTLFVKSERGIELANEQYLASGYEGTMIRLDRHYENCRTTSLLKYKQFMEEEFSIVDVIAKEARLKQSHSG